MIHGRRRLRKYLKAPTDLKARKRPLKRDELHQALGAAKNEAGRDARHVKVEVTLRGRGKNQRAAPACHIDRVASRVARRREGRYLPRTNIAESDPALLWEYYLRLTEVELHSIMAGRRWPTGRTEVWFSWYPWDATITFVRSGGWNSRFRPMRAEPGPGPG